MDAAAPPPAAVAPAPPPSPPAATDFYPRAGRERELCRAASRPDWLYLALGPATIAGTIVADQYMFNSSSLGVRMAGPTLVGLSWGFAVGSIYPALPKCSDTWVGETPREGSLRNPWPYALAASLFAAFTGPVVVGIESGYSASPAMSVDERQARLIVAAGASFAGALIPYVLPPRTLSAARELEKLRLAPLENGLYVGWSARF